MYLNQEAIEKIIPHRDPMLLISSVTELEPGRRITAAFYVAPEREIFHGHFPGGPVLPGVYTVEAMAQAADIMLLTTERYAGTTPLFLGIDGVRFIKKILPCDCVGIHASLKSERIDKKIAVCSADVFVHGELAATGTVTLAMR